MPGLSDSSTGGILVTESLAGEESIPLHRETVVAFVGPAPRGPAHVPVTVTSTEDFRRRFGSPAERSRLEWVLAQFFDNGGRSAIVVRVPRTGGHTLLALPGAGGALELSALHPGPLEYLRASVDLDHIPPDDLWRFNLTVQRIRSPANPLVEEQEIYHALTVDPDDEHFVGTVLAQSALVRLHGDPPRARPHVTAGPGRSGAPGYVNCRGLWQNSAPPTDYDLVGSRRDSTGLCALDQIPRVDFVCLLSGAPDADVGPVALFAAERYCQERQALLLLDPPTHWKTAADALRGQRERAFSSPNVLLYFPRLLEPGLDGARRDRPRQASAVGLLAAHLLRREAGAAAVPAATLAEPALLRCRSRVAVELEADESAGLLRAGVNVFLGGTPGFVGLAGGVTLARADLPREWRDASARRLALRVLGSVTQGTRWVVTQPPGAETWQAVFRQVAVYLAGLAADGAFAADATHPGWYVKCDQDLNRVPGMTSLVIGLALAAPGRYLAFRLDHDLRGCSISEVVWQPGVALAG